MLSVVCSAIRFGVQPYSYFMFSWGWTLSDGSMVDYPERLEPFSPAKSDCQRTTPDGWEFTREFEHAHVCVDTEKEQDKIIWR